MKSGNVFRVLQSNLNKCQFEAIELSVTITYTYDALYRLTQAAASNGDVYQYAYDAAGNRTLRVEPGVNETAVCRVKMVRVRR